MVIRSGETRAGDRTARTFMASIITLSTDFGRDSHYVAAMKGVILRIHQQATIVDITHTIPPQNVPAGSFVLGETTPWFPTGTIHVAVVDPGVGTGRRIVYAAIGDQRYICPDNGLLSYVCRRQKPAQIVEVSNSRVCLPAVSQTFHGRDIMAPAAAHLSLGFLPDDLGPPVSDLLLNRWPVPAREASAVAGQIIWIDSFGNLISNIQRDELPQAIGGESCFVQTDGHRVERIVKTYADAAPGTLVALFGSSGYLELAVAQGNAAASLQISLGDLIKVQW